ncbi:MAG: tetratricopeptide repeat protein [Lachnospiraceae bacterium]|nr:tetratricopeptide repeat protein [Lachnospiraceae bacterium]
MRCYNCGRKLASLDTCSYCGADVRMYGRAAAISNALYNEALYQAGNRELTGAIDTLRLSLRYNKENIDARNLLGLVYFEVGEVVDALSEWVISKNIQPDDNAADYYLTKIQSNPNKLETLNQAIKKYNQSLIYCKQGSDDLAVIQLKKVLVNNPNLVKAYQLISLLYLKNKEYERAKKSLTRAYRINKTDPLTMRYMGELEKVYKKGGRPSAEQKEQEKEERLKNKLLGKGGGYESGGVNGLINIIFGLVLGILATVFLIVPAVKHNSNSDVSNSLLSANEQLADKSSEIGSLEKKIKDLEAEKENLVKEASQTTEVREAYSALYKALNMKGGDPLAISEVLEGVKPEMLDESAKAYYQELKTSTDSVALVSYYKTADDALKSGNFDEAIKYFEKVEKLREGYQGGSSLLGLAQSYQGKNDKEKAKETYNKIIQLMGEDSVVGKAAGDALKTLNN